MQPSECGRHRQSRASEIGENRGARAAQPSFEALRHFWRALCVLGSCLIAAAPLCAAAANVEFLAQRQLFLQRQHRLPQGADAYANDSGMLIRAPAPGIVGIRDALHRRRSASATSSASYQSESIGAGWQENGVNSGPVVYMPPPDGTWVFALLITEPRRDPRTSRAGASPCRTARAAGSAGSSPRRCRRARRGSRAASRRRP